MKYGNIWKTVLVICPAAGGFWAGSWIARHPVHINIAVLNFICLPLLALSACGVAYGLWEGWKGWKKGQAGQVGT
ncbi:hypothetical protein [Novacetimonas cocois]|uniref:Uncharacterized protein n=1 Tax=Novacetimonas cocois TaxID=1747507 RepID=A0A365YWW1_9PROT|nr:hypothetical protein [Novacetimonas cocois]RBM07645.1 hypothetical protein NJLHNGOC_06295 [Novacetimonas cocois]